MRKSSSFCACVHLYYAFGTETMKAPTLYSCECTWREMSLRSRAVSAPVLGRDGEYRWFGGRRFHGECLQVSGLILRTKSLRPLYSNIMGSQPTEYGIVILVVKIDHFYSPIDSPAGPMCVGSSRVASRVVMDVCGWFSYLLRTSRCLRHHQLSPQING